MIFQALSGIRLVEKIESLGLETLMANTTGLMQPTLQGGLYSRRSLPSPMTQLTNLKGTLMSPSIDKNLAELGKAGTGTGTTNPGAGNKSRRRLDLGTVSGGSSSGEQRQQQQQQQQSSGPLGTISSMLFGRKGGLL